MAHGSRAFDPDSGLPSYERRSYHVYYDHLCHLHFMLAPLATPEKFYRLENFLCHYIVPLMFFFDTLVIDKPKQYRKSDPLAWTLLPLLYMVFALLNGLVLKWPVPGAKDSPFPYFFINVNRLVGFMWLRWRPSFLSLIY